jgi:mono/diheme cytochrome c family protein
MALETTVMTGAGGGAGRVWVFQRFVRSALVLASGILIAIGCSQAERQAEPAAPAAAPAAVPAPAPAATPANDAVAAQAEAEKIFSERCVTCHGASGGGDGPASAGLVPKPRNFHDEAWQKSVNDEYIEQIVQYGGAAVGKSPAMPANPDLMSKPAVVAALRAHVRSLAQ